VINIDLVSKISNQVIDSIAKSVQFKTM